MLAIGLVVATFKKSPISVAGITPHYLPQGDTGVMHFAPLCADILALFLLQTRKKLLETFIALVLPMKLHTFTQHKTGGCELLRLRLGRV